MFKTNNKISNEAESLYAEHKNIQGDIAKNTEYAESAKRVLDSMVESGLATDVHVDDVNFYVHSVKGDIASLETEATENVIKAAEHLRANPRLFDIAVKSARLDGIDIKTK